MNACEPTSIQGQFPQPGHSVPDPLSVDETDRDSPPQGASHSTADRTGLTPALKECLAALRAHGNTDAGAHSLHVSVHAFSGRIHELRFRGIIGAEEYKRDIPVRPRMIANADAERERNRLAREHVPEDIHFARKGETRSWIICRCDALVEAVDESLTLGHDALAAAFSAHRRPPMA